MSPAGSAAVYVHVADDVAAARTTLTHTLTCLLAAPNSAGRRVCTGPANTVSVGRALWSSSERRGYNTLEVG